MRHVRQHVTAAVRVDPPAVGNELEVQFPSQRRQDRDAKLRLRALGPEVGDLHREVAILDRFDREVLEDQQAFVERRARNLAPLVYLSDRTVFVLAQRKVLRLDLLQPRPHGILGAILTRTGSVLMNIPSVDSIPINSGGRPETVAPKTTSSSPL